MTLKTLAIVLALLAAVGTSEDDPILTPMDVIKKSDGLLESDPIRVRFRVGTVDAMRVNRADNTAFDQIRLHPNVNFEPSLRANFHVALSESIESTFHRIGIDDLEQHFKGKDIEVVGRLSRTGLHLIGSESYWFYYIEISDLKQMRSVTR